MERLQFLTNMDDFLHRSVDIDYSKLNHTDQLSDIFNAFNNKALSENDGGFVLNSSFIIPSPSAEDFKYTILSKDDAPPSLIFLNNMQSLTSISLNSYSSSNKFWYLCVKPGNFLARMNIASQYLLPNISKPQNIAFPEPYISVFMTEKKTVGLARFAPSAMVYCKIL
jgi:hypothetical protein